MATYCSQSQPFERSEALDQQRLEVNALEKDFSPLIHQAQTVPAITFVPGEPSLGLDRFAVHRFIVEELHTPLLDELFDKLWLVARRSGSSIDALHVQKMRQRSILPSEDPKLHLIRGRDRIYVEPIPAALLNYDFWAIFLSSPESDDRAVALGFVRSYTRLIRHRVDFAIAPETGLVPANVDWTEWQVFSARFRNIPSCEVAKRYQYGQIRLGRLDWLIRLCRPRAARTSWFYEVPYWSTAPYVERATVPLLFVFASLSLVLSSMQVIASITTGESSLSSLPFAKQQTILQWFWVFSVVVLILSMMVWLLFLVLPSLILASQILWGFRHRNGADPL